MGGIAFRDKVRRIKKDEISSTLDFVSKTVGIIPEYLKANVLGSALLSESAGDIDLNFSPKTTDIDYLYERLVDKLGSENVKDFRKTHQIFTCFPISGKASNGFVQVDFMFGDIEWQKFSYASPGNKSAYKGLFRTELIKALVAFNSDWVLVENDEVIARVGPTFFHDRGIIWRYRHRQLRKDGKGRVKAWSEITDYNEFNSLYPTAPKIVTPCINTAQDTCKLLFDANTSLDVFESYETLIEAIRAFYSYTELKEIMNLFFQRLNSLNVDIPLEILNETTSNPFTRVENPRNRIIREVI